MNGIYGQRISADGYSANCWDSHDDDDPENYILTVPFTEWSSDPDWLNEPLYGILVDVPGEDEIIHLPGQQRHGMRKEALDSY